MINYFILNAFYIFLKSFVLDKVNSLSVNSKEEKDRCVVRPARLEDVCDVDGVAVYDISDLVAMVFHICPARGLANLTQVICTSQRSKIRTV